jgi:predicted esterase
VSGKILVRAAVSDPPVGVLVGFHGYAENAHIHLDRLTTIPGTDRWVLVSVEGLNRFYRGRSDVTVASWMTREDRELAIAANIDYVHRAIEQVRTDYAPDPVPLVLAGFSQGGAMAFRAAARGSHNAAGVIAVGADVPPELLSAPDTRFPPVLLMRGARDDWYTQAKLDADVAALTARGVQVSALVADAGHEWTPEISAAAAHFLSTRAPWNEPE